MQIWTDVTGIMTSDPRIVKNARTIDQISYREAAELAYFGAKVIHPSTIQPAVNLGIPVWVKNTFRPEDAGTSIIPNIPGSGLKAIACKKGITLVSISSSRMLLAYGFLRRIFEIFEKYQTAVDLIATSEVSVSVTIDNVADAQAAGATVTIHFNRIEVYQHHSPGVTITFWGDNFTITRDRIRGPVSHAEFVTDPVNASLDSGNVSGSVHATLPMLTQKALINTTISEAVSADTLGQFREIASRNSLALEDVAYTLEVKKFNLTTGPANVTFTVPASWVTPRGGSDAVHITRISEDTRKTELLSTTYGGIDPSGNMIFRGDSPDGTSIFGLITAKAVATEQNEHPNMTYIPVSKPAIETHIRMYTWLFGIIHDNPALLVGVVAILALLAYLRWGMRRF